MMGVGAGIMTPKSTLVGNQSYAAGEDLTNKVGYIGYLSSGTILIADGTSLDRGAFASVSSQGGVIAYDVDSGQMSALADGLVWVLAGGALTADSLFTNDSSGLAVAATTSGDVPLGKVVQGAASGGKALVKYTGAIWPATP